MTQIIINFAYFAQYSRLASTHKNVKQRYNYASKQLITLRSKIFWQFEIKRENKRKRQFLFVATHILRGKPHEEREYHYCNC